MFLNYRACGDDAENLLDLSNWDTSNVRNFQGMFSGFNGYSLLGCAYHGVNVKFPKDGLTTGTQANISYMFENSNVITETTPVPDPSKAQFIVESVGIKLTDIIDTKDVVNFSHIFDGMYSTETKRDEKSGLFWYKFASIDVSGVNYEIAQDMSYMFANAFCRLDGGEFGGEAYVNGKLTLFGDENEGEDTPTINGEHFFDGCNADLLDLAQIDTSIFNNISYFFANYGYIDLHGKIYNLSNLSMANKTAVAGLFYNAYFDTEKGGDLVLD